MSVRPENPDAVSIPWWVVTVSLVLFLGGGLMLVGSMAMIGMAVIFVAIGLTEVTASGPLSAIVPVIALGSVAFVVLAACCVRSAGPRRRALLLTASICILLALAVVSLITPSVPLAAAFIGWIGFLLGWSGVTVAQFADLLNDRRHWRRVWLRRGRCPICGYSITGLPERRCPECGAMWSSDEGGAKASRDPDRARERID